MEITSGDSKVIAAIKIDKYGHELRTMRDGEKWVSQPITPELAVEMAKVIDRYIKHMSNSV